MVAALPESAFDCKDLARDHVLLIRWTKSEGSMLMSELLAEAAPLAAFAAEEGW